jgi:hypothetical protein
MSQHKVRTHKWYNGILQFRDFVFGSKEEAIEFATNADAHSAKIYDINDQVVHELTPTPVNTYA